MPLSAPAVSRGLALAWFVFRSRAVWWMYAAVMGADWAFCVLSMFVLRRVKDLPKVRLASAAALQSHAVAVMSSLLPNVIQTTSLADDQRRYHEHATDPVVLTAQQSAHQCSSCLRKRCRSPPSIRLDSRRRRWQETSP